MAAAVVRGALAGAMASGPMARDVATLPGPSAAVIRGKASSNASVLAGAFLALRMLCGMVVAKGAAEAVIVVIISLFAGPAARAVRRTAV